MKKRRNLLPLFFLVFAIVLLFVRAIWVAWHGEYVKGQKSFLDSLKTDVLIEAAILVLIAIAVATVIYLVRGKGKDE